MENSKADRPENQPWYTRSLLPAWLPGWLAACVLTGSIAAAVFGLCIPRLGVPQLAMIFAGGFAFTLCILTFTHAKTRPADRSSTLFPPLAIRFPVFSACAVGIAAIWVADGKITTGAARGSRVLLEGPTVDVLGMLIMLGAGVASVFFFRRPTGGMGQRAGGAVALLLSITGLTFAVVRVGQRWF